MDQNTGIILEHLIMDVPPIGICKESILKAFDILNSCYLEDGKVLVCGNGGSAADSEHIVGELMKGFLVKRAIGETHNKRLKDAFPHDWSYLSQNLQGALPAISLVSQSAISSAYINDVAADMVFAQQVYGYGKTGDVLMALSTSGNSKNVINAVKVARAFNIKTIGFTGSDGGKMKELCDICIMVPATAAYKVQEYHLPVYHALCAMIEAEFFNKQEKINDKQP